MGLTTFVGNQPTLREAKIVKNYLNEKELKAMSCIRIFWFCRKTITAWISDDTGRLGQIPR